MRPILLLGRFLHKDDSHNQLASVFGKRMAPINLADVPVVKLYGRRGGNLVAMVTSTFASDRGDAIAIPAADPRAAAATGGD